MNKLGAQIAAARKAECITQECLADRVGTTQSVISRIEQDHYEGHTLSLLARVADALNCRVDVRLVPAGSPHRKKER